MLLASPLPIRIGVEHALDRSSSYRYLPLPLVPLPFHVLHGVGVVMMHLDGHGLLVGVGLKKNARGRDEADLAGTAVQRPCQGWSAGEWLSPAEVKG